MSLRALTIDFNSYFASVEQQERPELRGQPVGIVPLMAETTGCIAVSIEAKQLGLTRNARVAEARRLVPGIRIVEARPELYISYHRRLVEIVESCLHVEKVQCIDEMTCMLSGPWAERDRAVAVARQMKAKIAREAGPCLRCSVGIAPNWLLAKVASDLEKPDGLVVLEDADIPAKLLRLRPGDIAGIGENMQRRLAEHGITTRTCRFLSSRRARPSATARCCRRKSATTPPRAPCCTACCKRPHCACATPASLPARCTSACGTATGRAGARVWSWARRRTR